MAAQTLIFEPTDVLFFRDSRPFAAGENFRAGSLFPPAPEPFVGAIRTAAIVRQGVSFEDYVDGNHQIPGVEQLYQQIGPPDRLGDLEIKGPFLVYCDENPRVVLPAPADMVYHTSTHSGFRCVPVKQRFVTSRPVKLANSQCSLRPVAVSQAGEGSRVSLYEGQFLSTHGWMEYLLGLSVNVAERVDASRLWQTELRTGIKLNSRRTTEEGMFYSIDTIRFSDAEKIKQGQAYRDRHQFVVMVEGLDETLLPGAGAADHVPLGGQRRTTSVERVSPDSPISDQLAGLKAEAIINAIAGGNSLRLCLITPAIFAQGSLPDFLQLDADNESMVTTLAGVDLRLVAAVVPKALRIGGWNYAKRMPKAIRLAVPAGSVYYFEKPNAERFTPEEAADLFHLLHFQSICRTWGTNPQLSDQGKRGLGICLLGN